MTTELIRLIDADTARAIEEAAKLGAKVMDAGTGAGSYLARIVETVPQNLVGLLLGDWLVHERIRRWAELNSETREHLTRWGAAR